MTAVPPVPPETPGKWVCLARIRRPQGRRGEVFADILTDFPDKFSERRQLWLLDAPEYLSPRSDARLGHPGLEPCIPVSVQLANHWLHKGGVILHFVGVDSISEAEKLTGRIVGIPREQRAVLAEDAVYISDLIGCLLIDVVDPDAPITVGEIQDVERAAGPVPILMVGGAHGEVLVPFAKDYLCRIDLDARRVEMALPEGLVDLNA